MKPVEILKSKAKQLNTSKPFWGNQKVTAAQAISAMEEYASPIFTEGTYYREVRCEDRLPTQKGPYYVKVKSPEGSMMVFGNHDIYMWLDGPTEPQRELWLNTFEFWLEKIVLSKTESK